ncbi:MAG: glycosyltransferase family 4 protein [bacterium]
MKKVLYIKHADSSFVLADQRTLEKYFSVKTFLIDQKRPGFYFLLRMLNLCWFITRNAPGTDAMIAWFGDYHSSVMAFFGKLFRIKVIIFAGGQEAICYPELQKGVYYKKWRGRAVRYALRNASHIMPNHKSLIWHENFYYDKSGKKDGIKYYIPGIQTPMTVVPNGIETGRFYRDHSILKKPARILTVGTMSSRADFLNKGFDLFAELARRNPDLDCVIVGIKQSFMPWIEEQYRITTIPNLKLIFYFCTDDVLLQQYNEAKVFVQASITEGMPNTLSEAMLCECIPVGSDVNGIPDAMGGCGVIVPRRDILDLEKAVRKALSMDTGGTARIHAMSAFTREKREEQLMLLLNKII